MHHVRPDLMALTALRVVWARERERESIDELDMWEVAQNLPSGGIEGSHERDRLDETLRPIGP